MGTPTFLLLKVLMRADPAVSQQAQEQHLDLFLLFSTQVEQNCVARHWNHLC